MSEKRSGAPRAKARGSFYFPAKPMLRRYTALIRLAAYFGNLPGAYLPIHPRVKTRGFLGEGIKYCVPGFSVRDNVLSYVFEGGGRIDFRGEWSLDDENNLVFSLKDDGEDPGRIVLRGRIISARAGVLAFEAAGVNENGTLEWQVFELYGQWYADGDGKLAFRLRKSGGSRGRLVFQSSWEINEDQEIVYKYTRERLKRTGERETVCVSFSGRWSVFSSSRLVYSLSGSSREGFAFKAHLQTPNLYPAAGRIKYRIGAGVSRGREIVLYGQWKFGRGFSLGFEMEYGPGKRERMYFDAGFKSAGKDSVTFRLRTREGGFSGMSLVLSREFLAADNKAKAFAQFVLNNDEKAVNAGVKFEF